MSKLFDYIQWRGDLSQTASPFSEIDYAIFSQIVMLDLADVFTTQKEVKVKNAFLKHALENDLNKNLGLIISNKTNYLFREIARAKRYKNLVLSDYVASIDAERAEQFSAITVTLSKGKKLVVFSGTDDTLVGWKENFSMTYKEYTSGQNKSVKYLEKIAKTCDDIVVVGHSKGANLAMYSTVNCDDKTYAKISATLAFDGPGFFNELTDEKRLERASKIVEYVTDTSVIGRFFNHYGIIKIVQSSYNGMFQHDLFSWAINKNKFVYLSSFTSHGEEANETFHNVLCKMNKDECERLFGILFNLLNDVGLETLTDMSLKKMKVIKGYASLNPDDKKFVKQALTELIKNKAVKKIFLGDFFDKDAQAILKNSKKYAVIEAKNNK